MSTVSHSRPRLADALLPPLPLPPPLGMPLPAPGTASPDVVPLTAALVLPMATATPVFPGTGAPAGVHPITGPISLLPPGYPLPSIVIAGSVGGGSTLIGGNGPQSFLAYGYGNTIEAGNGNSVISVNEAPAITAGNNNTITGGNGNDTVYGVISNSTVTLGNGNDAVVLSGFNDTVVLGNGNDTVVLQAGAGNGGHNVTLGGGNDTVDDATTGDRIAIGDGVVAASNTVTAAGNDSITCQGGDDTVALTGPGDQASFYGAFSTVSATGGDSVAVHGGHSTITLTGTGNQVLLDNSQAALQPQWWGTQCWTLMSVIIQDQAQSLDITASGANAGYGADILMYVAQDPSFTLDLVAGFGGFQSVADVLANIQPDLNAGSMLVSHDGASVIHFIGVAQSHLSAANFQVG